MNLDPGAVPELRLVFLVVGLNVLLELPGAVVIGHLYGLQRHAWVSGVRLASLGVSTFAIFRFLSDGAPYALLRLALITLCANVGVYAVLGLRLRAIVGVPLLDRRAFSRPLLRELWGFGLRSMGLMLASRLRRQSVPFVVAHTVGPQAIAYYSVASRLADSAWGLATTLAFPITPVFSALHGAGDREALRRAWLAVSRVLQFFLLAVPVGLLAMGMPFLQRWMGDAFAQAGRWVLYFTAASLLFEGLAPSSGSILVSQARHGAAAKGAIGLAVLAVGAAYLGGLTWGLAGVALGMSALGSLTSMNNLRLACRSMDIGVLAFVRATGLRCLPAMVAMALVLWGANRWNPPSSYGRIALNAALGLLGYVVAIWFLTLRREERAAVRSWIARRWPWRGVR